MKKLEVLNSVDPTNILRVASDDQLASYLVTSFKDIQKNFVVKRWKPAELDGGHFVEAVRRFIDYKLTGSYIPFNTRLADLNDQEMKRYEKQVGDESYRLLIPRILLSIYGIRNKRGVGHLSTKITPNKMDSTIILYSAKWVLAELIRLNSNLNIEETQAMVDELMDRQLEIIWKDDGIFKILNYKLSAKSKTLIALYEKGEATETNLQKIVDYKNKTDYSRLLKNLKSEVLIEIGANGLYKISPTGMVLAEQIILENKNK